MSEFTDNLKKVALPVATVVVPIFGIVGTVFWFAAESWVQDIVQAEIDGDQTTQGQHATTLTEHKGKLEQHDEEIEDNEDDIKSQDARFTDFVRELLSR